MSHHLPDSAPLQLSDVEMTAGETPYSARYGDVYHARAGALAQAAHVFLAGNDLPGRWQGRSAFTVCETGFGLGLNFLALCLAWAADQARCARLQVVSLEAHPCSVEQLREAWGDGLPEAAQPWAEALLAQWPQALPGLHRLTFAEGAVTLTLGLGWAEQLVPQLDVDVDAFFLDGFSPARNPAMWAPSLMQALAGLAAPGATAATWASAGLVRRGLAEAGFVVEKRPGFADKRDMTVARHPGAGRAGRAGQGEWRERTAMVVGAGLAGAGVARALAQRGWQVQVLAPDQGQADGQPAAALTPVLEPTDSVRARLVRAGALCSARVWSALGCLDAAGAPLTRLGAGAAVSRVGTVQVAGARAVQRAGGAEAWCEAMRAPGWSPSWVQVWTAAEASAHLGTPVERPALFWPQGLLVLPDRLCAALLDDAAIVRHHVRVTALRQAENGDWQALDADGQVLGQASVVVVAAAAASADLLATAQVSVPALARLEAVAGQVSRVQVASADGQRDAAAADEESTSACNAAEGDARHTSANLALPYTVSGAGYVLPAVDGEVVVGSTYTHGLPPGSTAPLTAEGHDYNLAQAASLLPASAGWTASAGWAGWRAVVPGRLPVIGRVAPGLWVSAAYGSRGLAWSALAGEVVAARLEGEPGVLPLDLLVAIDPARRAG